MIKLAEKNINTVYKNDLYVQWYKEKGTWTTSGIKNNWINFRDENSIPEKKTTTTMEVINSN